LSFFFPQLNSMNQVRAKIIREFRGWIGRVVVPCPHVYQHLCAP
jgi:hypothetical protein